MLQQTSKPWLEAELYIEDLFSRREKLGLSLGAPYQLIIVLLDNRVNWSRKSLHNNLFLYVNQYYEHNCHKWHNLDPSKNKTIIRNPWEQKNIQKNFPLNQKQYLYIKINFIQCMALRHPQKSKCSTPPKCSTHTWRYHPGIPQCPQYLQEFNSFL